MTNEEIMKVVKPAICAQLKSPASAQFPIDVISIVGDDARGYQVQGFVDSQNGYGAMIRSDFEANVTVVNGFPSVTSSSVGKKKAINDAKQFGVNYLAISLIGILMAVLLTALSYFIISSIVGM